jgi:nucleotide-binding universal stress UspA family protein
LTRDDLIASPAPPLGHEIPGPYLRILVAFNGSPTSWLALERAIEIAVEHNGILTLAGVAIEPAPWVGFGPYAAPFSYAEIKRDIELDLERALAAARDEIPASVGVRTRVLRGRHAAPVIAREAANGNYDLLVTGPRGLGGGPFRRSVTRALLARAPISVLAVRG